MNTSFQKTKGNDEWFTPPEIVKTLGKFDLDPCTSKKYPYRYAKKIYDKKKDGLKWKWIGRVWCNPPYGREVEKWIHKCARHNNCVVLVFFRPDTQWFHKYVWNYADAILVFSKRLKFYTIKGEQYQWSAGSASVLVAYGKNNAKILKKASLRLKGKFIQLKGDRYG